MGKNSIVNLSLEVDDVAQGVPPLDPMPGVEFGMIDGGELDRLIAGDKAKHVPELFLAETSRVRVSALVSHRQVIAKPEIGAADYFDITTSKPELLVELAVERLFHRLADVDTALRKLPASVFGRAGPKHFVALASQDDSNVGAISISVNRLGYALHCAFDSRRNRAQYNLFA